MTTVSETEKKQQRCVLSPHGRNSLLTKTIIG